MATIILAPPAQRAQALIKVFMLNYQDENHYPPTIDEISAHLLNYPPILGQRLNVSQATILKFLAAMIQDGRVHWNAHGHSRPCSAVRTNRKPHEPK